MKSLHLTIMIFGQVLLASVVLYQTTYIVSASPIVPSDGHTIQKPAEQASSLQAKSDAYQQHHHHQQHQAIADTQSVKDQPHKPVVQPKSAAPSEESIISAKSASPPVAHESPAVVSAAQPKQAVAKEPKLIEDKVVVVPQAEASPIAPAQQPKHNDKVAPVAAVQQQAIITARKDDTSAAQAVAKEQPNKVLAEQPAVTGQQPQAKSAVKVIPSPPQAPVASIPQPEALVFPKKDTPKDQAPAAAPKVVDADQMKPRMDHQAPVAHEQSAMVKPASSSVVAAVVKADPAPVVAKSNRKVDEQQSAPVVVKESAVVGKSEVQSKVVPEASPSAPTKAAEPVVKGGLGPLHLLATTLCNYQPDRPVADETLNQLYTRRAIVRKSLFEFMSLKFTNLEKLSSRLGYGLQVVPAKTIQDPAASRSSGSPASVGPSHGWPVVGKCTAHDLKLMGEAAWCESEAAVSPSEAAVATSQSSDEPQKITSNKHQSRVQAGRAIVEPNSFLPSPEQSSVISKLLHVSDVNQAPVVDSTIYNLNLTQQQLATLEAHATSTRECRRNALKYTKALFNHLAEDQRNTSESWPKLYALISTDDCARKRMIDVISALSGFRTDTTSIRRDNLEFAFAMDDLRTKVLDKEVNVPLTFDKQFIEVEQFLQQSVRLMLSNIDPTRAKLTSMRYRSLMYGTVDSDDQCIELHQRLLAQSYPVDCNPNQFGQLPDVLRMTASSLELWSIEKEIGLHTAKLADYPVGQQKVKDDVNECIANLVSS